MHELEQPLLVAAALLARLGPLIWLAPFIGGRLVPPLVKTTLALLLAGVLYPQVAGQLDALIASGPVAVAAAVAKESVIGLALGFIVGLVFWAAQAAGWLVDAARGANLAEAMVPQQGERSSPLGSLYFQLAVVLFIALGGHRLFIAAMARSYEALPLHRFPDASGWLGLARLCIRLSGDLVLVALSLAAPVVAAVLVTDLALGWVNRFAPQINVFFLAMPLKALLGIAVVVLGLSLLLGGLPPLMDRALYHVDQALQLLR